MREKGWAEEAAQKAAELHQSAVSRRDRWKAVLHAGASLADNPATQLPEDFSVTPIARLFFYDAVRAAPTSEAVQGLLPLAQELDDRAGGNILKAYVQRVAARNFEQRGPLSRGYAALVRGRLSAPEKDALLKQILASEEEDLIVGALVQTGAIARNFEFFAQKSALLKDPWFQLTVAQEHAAVDRLAGMQVRATRTLRDALPLCQGMGLEYRCLSLKIELSTLLIKHHEFKDARRYAEEAWQEARASNEWSLEQSALWNLGRIARLVNDTALSLAYFEEYLEQFEDQADAKRRIHENLASVAFQKLHVDEARREIDAALAAGDPLSPSGAFTLAEIGRLKRAPEDEAHLKSALERGSAKRSPGERAVDTHVLGRFFIEQDPAQGRELLWQSIQEASAPGMDEDLAALRARAYSFTSLILEAGRRDAFNEALELFSQERGQQIPSRCLLAATADSERTLLIVRSADGKLLGWQDETRREPLPERLDGLVREDLLAALRPCERVEVLARPPLHGRPGLLPLSMAWSYLTRLSSPQAPRTGPALHLVVSGVEIPTDLDVNPLPPWVPPLGPDEKLVPRLGAEATPSRIRSAMKDATEIDLITHGFVHERSDESYLLLAPERGERDLTVPQVRKMQFRGAPFVVLVACHGGHTSYALHEPWSLPASFIYAGARGVLAATEQIPDVEGYNFFIQVRERIRAGVPPMLALRDVRAQWLKKDPKQAWLASVLLFE
ncbi:CHAT domain-containing protein [Stigmatella sp. ncwal1]|uniref:CHAT domain-containing protein n=1 Tax=Stigmatella ashevillensis TaxID=2995309 RepID=A0ABT5D7H3_9BACT|nr:CHAT domain-containing protein [Stigmatella ashevillena]MDC0709613.1 CHAT domain-containing protein [Stigmatella ashevillena]